MRQKEPDGIGKHRRADEPFVTGYLIDSVLYRPNIPQEHEKLLIDEIYALKNLFETNKVPCRFDLGTSIPRAATSISRLFAKREAGTDEIKMAFEHLEDMITLTNDLYSTKYPRSAMMTREPRDRKLYLFIIKMDNVDVYLPEELIIQNLNKIPMSIDQYRESFSRLNEEGLLIKNSKGEIRALEPTDEQLNYYKKYD